MGPNTILLQDTEAFMRGELDNVTVAGGCLVLDMVQGAYVPYGCYTSQTLTLPPFDALRASWNVEAPAGTAVEVQARVLTGGAWSPWCSLGRWSPHLPREVAAPAQRGDVRVEPDQISLAGGQARAQAQLRIYLYTRVDKATPIVHLLALSARPVDVIPDGGRAVNARLHLIPYVVERRAPALRAHMDLAISLASLTNRWGADLLPEELALIMRDHRPGTAPSLSFAAAAVACWGFPAWVGWADLAGLRAELRAGFGVVVALESTPAQQEQGLPAVRYAALRGFANGNALLIDPWAGGTDFDAETEMPLDAFLVAWNSLGLFVRRQRQPGANCPTRTPVTLRPLPEHEGIYGLYLNGVWLPLPDNYVEDEEMGPGVLAWSVPDERPHATTAHRLLHFVQPQAGGIRLEPAPEGPRRYTVYAIGTDGSMLVGDATL